MKQYSLEEWNDLCRPFYDVRHKTDAHRFSAMADFRQAGQLALTNVRFCPQTFIRDPSKIKGFDNEFLLFERYDSGEGRGVAGECATEINQQILHLVDMNQQYITSTTDVVSRGVLIPHSLLGYDPSRHSHYVSVSRFAPRARLLETALDAIDAAFVTADEREINDLADAFSGLVRKLMLGCEEETELQSANAIQDHTLYSYIETHLTDLDLGIEHLSLRFNLSRASLYRRFDEEGGVMNYISGRRLDKCLQELCMAPPTRGRIRAVAERWGFTDPSSFNRRFRNRFNLAPSDCLSLDQQFIAKTHTSRQHLIHHWMRQHRH